MLLLQTILGAPSAARVSNRICFQIEQKSKLCGDVEVFFDAQAMRVHFKKSNLFLITRAPDWKVYKFNPATKKYCVWRYAEFHNKLAETRAMMGAPTNVDVLVHRSGKKTYENYDAHVYSSSGEYYKKAQNMYTAHEITGSYPDSIEVTTLAAGDCTPQEAHILNVALAIPQTTELPIASRGVGCDGKTYVYLTTAKIAKTAPATDWLDVPTTYTKVDDETKMTSDEQLNQNFADFISVGTRPTAPARAASGK